MNKISRHYNGNKEQRYIYRLSYCSTRFKSRCTPRTYCRSFYVLLNLFSRVPIILKYATSESSQFLTCSPFINILTPSSSLYNTVPESEEPNGPKNRRSFLAYVPYLNWTYVITYCLCVGSCVTYYTF